MNGNGLPQNIGLNYACALFDTAWYLDQNPDIAQAGCDPLQHYLEYGAWEMRNPNPLFDSDWYLAVNPEVAQTGVNPLVHYLTIGAAENRDPHPLFDTRTYREVCGPLPAQMTPARSVSRRFPTVLRRGISVNRCAVENSAAFSGSGHGANHSGSARGRIALGGVSTMRPVLTTPAMADDQSQTLAFDLELL